MASLNIPTTPPVTDFGTNPPRIVLVTGLSGAGKSTALHVLEDLGFFCVDNLPMRLAPGLLSILDHKDPDDVELRRVGFGVDVRTGGFLEGTGRVLKGLREAGYIVSVLFIDAADEVLVRRYSESRRPHPLAPGGDILQAIHKERERLSSLRAASGQVIDTSELSVHELRRYLVDYLGREGARRKMLVRVVSFGFKYGIPMDADLVFDLRYLPNPYFIPELKPRSGMEEAVAQFVLGSEPAKELLNHLEPMLTSLLPRYAAEGKAYLTIAVGCTGGRHRSVALAEHLGRVLGQDQDVVVAHRDVHKASKKPALPPPASA